MYEYRLSVKTLFEYFLIGQPEMDMPFEGMPPAMMLSENCRHRVISVKDAKRLWIGASD